MLDWLVNYFGTRKDKQLWLSCRPFLQCYLLAKVNVLQLNTSISNCKTPLFCWKELTVQILHPLVMDDSLSCIGEGGSWSFELIGNLNTYWRVDCDRLIIISYKKDQLNSWTLRKNKLVTYCRTLTDLNYVFLEKFYGFAPLNQWDKKWTIVYGHA